MHFLKMHLEDTKKISFYCHILKEGKEKLKNNFIHQYLLLCILFLSLILYFFNKQFYYVKQDNTHLKNM